MPSSSRRRRTICNTRRLLEEKAVSPSRRRLAIVGRRRTVRRQPWLLAVANSPAESMVGRALAMLGASRFKSTTAPKPPIHNCQVCVACRRLRLCPSSSNPDSVAPSSMRSALCHAVAGVGAAIPAVASHGSRVCADLRHVRERAVRGEDGYARCGAGRQGSQCSGRLTARGWKSPPADPSASDARTRRCGFAGMRRLVVEQVFRATLAHLLGVWRWAGRPAEGDWCGGVVGLRAWRGHMVRSGAAGRSTPGVGARRPPVLERRPCTPRGHFLERVWSVRSRTGGIPKQLRPRTRTWHCTGECELGRTSA